MKGHKSFTFDIVNGFNDKRSVNNQPVGQLDDANCYNHDVAGSRHVGNK